MNDKLYAEGNASNLGITVMCRNKQGPFYDTMHLFIQSFLSAVSCARV